MKLSTAENLEFNAFIDNTERIIADLSPYAKGDTDSIKKLQENFKKKTDDFYRENRKLNIGVVGQVKAGKSSFLNTLLFDGKEILPKAATPKTATLTKMEYSEENIIQIDYYSVEDWENIEECAAIDSDEEFFTSSREIVELVRKNGFDPRPYLEKRSEQIKFDTYDDLIAHLNDYVGEDGKYTPIVEAVTLYLNKEEFKGLSIVDTPGLNDPIVSRTIKTKEFMELCDVVFFLSQSGSFLDKKDWELLSAQLPQKGVKKLVLIASKYDSGIRDVLREKDDDDIFGDDDNTADNIPDACKIIRKKLKKRAKSKVDEYVKDLELRGCTELIEVVRQCEEPYMASAMAFNMSRKNVSDYTSEENNVYSALKQFSSDMDSDLDLLGGFDKIRELFDEAVAEKEQILMKKSENFVPNATEELSSLLTGYKEKAENRIKALEENDIETLTAQKNIIEKQMNSIKADVTSVFGELTAKLETEKSNATQRIREDSKDFSSIKERTGSVTKSGSYTTGHLFWKKTEHYTYEEHYSYFLAADVIENLNKFAMDASAKIEEVFTEAVQFKDIKRKILNVVIENFDMGSEKYDSSLFKIAVEETVNAIELPIIDMDISDTMNSITGKFNGEIVTANKKNELSTAMLRAINKIYDELIKKLAASVSKEKEDFNKISLKLQESLVSNIIGEFEMLQKQCENKETEIQEYRQYTEMLDKSLKILK